IRRCHGPARSDSLEWRLSIMPASHIISRRSISVLFHSIARAQIAADAFRLDAWIVSLRLLSEVFLFSSQTFSLEQLPIRTTGSIAGRSLHGSCQRRTESATARFWRCL